MSERHSRHGATKPSGKSLSRRSTDRQFVVGATVVVLVCFLLVGTLGQIAPISYVNSASMSPTLATGDGFVAVPTSVADRPEPGDVIVYRSETIEAGGLVTHRIVGETEDGFVTRGDANPVTDQQAGEPPVSRDRIVAHALAVDGRVVALPNVGTASMWLRTHVRTVGAGIPAVWLELLAVIGSAVLFWRGRRPLVDWRR